MSLHNFEAPRYLLCNNTAMQQLAHIRTLLLSCFLFSCATNQVKLVDSDKVSPFSAQGWGGTTCKELIHDITPKNVGFGQAVQNIHLYQSWASGFVSGVNYSDSEVYDVSGATQPQEIFAWLKGYCTDHLDTAVPIALHKLIEVWEQEGKILVKAK